MRVDENQFILNLLLINGLLNRLIYPFNKGLSYLNRFYSINSLQN